MKRILVAFAAVAVAIGAAPLVAQQRIQVTPFYGYIMPQGDLPATFALDTKDGRAVDISNGKLEDRTPFYGATVGVRLFKALSIEGTLLTGTDKMTATLRPESDVKILAYSGGLAFELPRYWRIEPFLIGGVGVKSYDFDIDGTKAEKDIEYNFGTGVNVEVLRNVAVNLQVRDFVSDFSSSLSGVANEKQNDILIAAGLTFTFGRHQNGVAAIQH